MAQEELEVVLIVITIVITIQLYVGEMNGPLIKWMFIALEQETQATSVMHTSVGK